MCEHIHMYYESHCESWVFHPPAPVRCPVLSTGLPIMFGLRLDLNEKFTHNTTDTTQGQLQLIHEQMAALAALPAMEQQLAAQQQQLAALLALQEQLVALQHLVIRTCS